MVSFQIMSVIEIIGKLVLYIGHVNQPWRLTGIKYEHSIGIIHAVQVNYHPFSAAFNENQVSNMMYIQNFYILPLFFHHNMRVTHLIIIFMHGTFEYTFLGNGPYFFLL